MKYAELQGI